jgi:hypothetical protein
MNLVAGAIALTVVGAGSVAKAVPAPGQVSIAQAKVIGSGCPAGLTATINTGNALVIWFSDNFTATAGTANGNKAADRKSCQISLLLNTPAGYQFALNTFHVFGDSYLGPGAKAQQLTKTWFQGTASTAYYATFVNGGPWAIDDSFVTPVYSACIGDQNANQRWLNITTAVQVTDPNPTASTSFISEELAFVAAGSPQWTFDLDFQPCY